MTMKIENKLVMQTNSEDENITIKQIVPNSSRLKIISSKRYKSTYGTGAEEEVPRRCGVVGEASSRVRTLPKNLIALLPYRIARGGVSEAYCPVSRCTPEDGMGKA